MRPLLLDLFCGAGGAAVGYSRAGFDVVGVDIAPQPYYPFRFVLADVFDIASEFLESESLSAIHASPPCQAMTNMSNRWRGLDTKADTHTNMIKPTRDILEISGLPYVIENVPGARDHLHDPVVLTGGMFDLGTHRPRLFETNWTLTTPPRAKVKGKQVGVYGAKCDGRRLWTRKDGSILRCAASVAEGQEAMGMPWVQDWRGIAEAIPPAYTEYIGQQLIKVAA